MWELLSSVWVNNRTLDWTVAALLVLSVIGVLKLLISTIATRMALSSKKTETKLDDLILRCLENVKTISIVFFGFYLGALNLNLPTVVDEFLQKGLILVFLLQGALWANTVVNHILTDWAREKYSGDSTISTALGSIGFLVRGAVWAMFLMLALDNVGLDVGPLIASLGIGGVALALALQNVLGDLFASFSIVFDKPFVVGDFIETGGFEGRVQHVGLKTTRLEALSGEQLIVSNSDLLSSRIRNFEKRAKRRISFILRVVYDTPSEKLEKIPGILREIIKKQKVAQFDRAFLTKLGTHGINFEAVYFIEAPDLSSFGTVNHDINMGIIEKFGLEGIEFAVTSKTINV
tara:strand:+ start:4806 stop:5849 length:1044 start_codon:yes stop_codon:yes gene_type:complete